MTIKEKYNKTGKNFMTPTIVDYKIINDTVIELSKGEYMQGKTMYAVSFLADNYPENNNDYLTSEKQGELFQGDNAYQHSKKFYDDQF